MVGYKFKNHFLRRAVFTGLLLMLWVVGLGAFHTHAAIQDSSLEHCDFCIVQQQLQHSLQTTQQPLLFNATASFLASFNKFSFFPITIISTNLSRAPPATI